ncbi:MAG: hypothetical protein V1909_04195 [Candidatus Micrarchaeota archaeon]
MLQAIKKILRWIATMLRNDQQREFLFREDILNQAQAGANPHIEWKPSEQRIESLLASLVKYGLEETYLRKQRKIWGVGADVMINQLERYLQDIKRTHTQTQWNSILAKLKNTPQFQPTFSEISLLNHFASNTGRVCTMPEKDAWCDIEIQLDVPVYVEVKTSLDYKDLTKNFKAHMRDASKKEPKGAGRLVFINITRAKENGLYVLNQNIEKEAQVQLKVPKLPENYQLPSNIEGVYVYADLLLVSTQRLQFPVSARYAKPIIDNSNGVYDKLIRKK